MRDIRRPPHPATIARQRAPHPATVQRRVRPHAAKALRPAGVTVQRADTGLERLSLIEFAENRSRRDDFEDIRLEPIEREVVALGDVDPERAAIEKALAKSGGRTLEQMQDLLFHQLETMCQEILRRFPPNRFFYLGLGRSPTPIIAYLQELARKEPHRGIGAANLPLGGIKGIGKDYVQLRTFSAQERVNLFRFFERYLDTGLYGAKTVLLMDFVESGSGLKVAEQLLKRFAGNPTSFAFITGKMDIRVNTLAFYPRSRFKGRLEELNRMERRYRAFGFQTMDIPGDFDADISLAAFLPTEVYKPLAEYCSARKRDAKFTLESAAAGELPVRSEAYDALRLRIRHRLH